MTGGSRWLRKLPDSRSLPASTLIRSTSVKYAGAACPKQGAANGGQDPGHYEFLESLESVIGSGSSVKVHAVDGVK